jgi:hypothetical protein
MKKSLAPIREAVKRVEECRGEERPEDVQQDERPRHFVPLRICLHISLASTRDQRPRVGRLKISLQVPNLPSA